MEKDIKYKKRLLIEMARRNISSNVYELSSFEGNPLTVIQIQTILDGVTLGGTKLSDRNQVINLKNAWEMLLRLLLNNKFNEKDINIWKSLHFILGKDEIMNAGYFRNGTVDMDGAEKYICPDPKNLNDLFKSEIVLNKNSDVIQYALDILLSGFYNQFFYNGNKRISRFIVNGILINNGIGLLKIHTKDVPKFYSELKILFNKNDRKHMRKFLADKCIIPVEKYL